MLYLAAINTIFTIVIHDNFSEEINDYRLYEETLTGRPHDTPVQKAAVTMKMWM